MTATSEPEAGEAGASYAAAWSVGLERDERRDDHAGLPGRDVLGLLGILGLLLAAWLLAPPVYTRGEAREGLVVRNIVQTGEWILPHRLGIVASKPPLYHWIAAAGAHVAGLSDRMVRLPSLLAAWGLVLVTFLLGRTAASNRSGWIAVAVLLATRQFWLSALEARVDMLFAACVATALTAFLAWYRAANGAARAVFYGATAAAVLVKGPSGLVLVGAVVAGFVVLERDWGLVSRLWSWPLAFASAAVMCGWYGLAAWQGGSEFVRVQLLHENVDRLFGTGTFVARRGTRSLKLVGAFLAGLLPWNLALVWRARPASSLEAVEMRFQHCWWATVLLVFSLAAGKRAVYLLPLYPAVAALAGRSIATRLALPRARLVVVGAVALAAVWMGTVLVTGRAAARRSPLLAFAAAVERAVPPGTPIAVSGRVSENDMLVLGYRLGRPMTRAARATAPAGLLVEVPRAAAALPCRRVVPAEGAGGPLVLLSCEDPA